MPIGRSASDDNFQIFPSAEPGEWDIRVAFSISNQREGSVDAAGTTYSACLGLGGKPYVDVWGAYKAGRIENNVPGSLWRWFYKSIPTYPRVSEGLDPIFGRTLIFSYETYKSATRPDVADEIPATAGAVYLTLNSGGNVTLNAGGNVELEDVRVVRAVDVKDLGQNLCEVSIITVASKEVTHAEDIVDEETGRKLTVSKTYTLQANKPDGSGVVASTGLYTEVSRLEHNLWLSTTQPASALPATREAAVPVETIGFGGLWPAVLDSYNFTRVLIGGSDSEQLLSYTLRDDYGGDVKIITREWFQFDPPTVALPTQMLPSEIKVGGRDLGFTIPRCLHGVFVAEEWNGIIDMSADNTSYTLSTNQMLVWTYAPTALTDWPETITRLSVRYTRGGYRCKEELIHRPTDYNVALLTVSRRAATAAETVIGGGTIS